jgi:hypothetical protein
MKYPPLFFRIRIIEKGAKRIGLWFPALLLWIVLLPLILLALFLTLIGDLMTLFQYRLTQLLAGILAVIGELKGTIVHIDNRKTNSQVRVTIL